MSYAALQPENSQALFSTRSVRQQRANLLQALAMHSAGRGGADSVSVPWLS